MCEVENTGDAVDQRQAECDQRVKPEHSERDADGAERGELGVLPDTEARLGAGHEE